MNLEAEYIEKNAISRLSIKLVPTAKQNREMSFCLRTNKSFFYLLWDKKNFNFGGV